MDPYRCQYGFIILARARKVFAELHEVSSSLLVTHCDQPASLVCTHALKRLVAHFHTEARPSLLLQDIPYIQHSISTCHKEY